MDTEESGVRNSICSEDAASNTSNYSSPGKVSRMSSSFDEQSDSSGESDDNEADADIDQMLTELEDFQVVSNIRKVVHLHSCLPTYFCVHVLSTSQRYPFPIKI